MSESSPGQPPPVWHRHGPRPPSPNLRRCRLLTRSYRRSFPLDVIAGAVAGVAAAQVAAGATRRLHPLGLDKRAHHIPLRATGRQSQVPPNCESRWSPTRRHRPVIRHKRATYSSPRNRFDRWSDAAGANNRNSGSCKHESGHDGVDVTTAAVGVEG